MKQSINNENFEKEFNTFWENVKFAGLTNDAIAKNFPAKVTMMEKLRQATCALNEETGCAYPGALLVHINLTTALAKRIAKMISGTFRIDEQSLVTICTLMHLSKIEMYEPNDNQWEIEKRGMNYKFTELDGKLKFGERSILKAMEWGVILDAEEFEAIRCLDKENEEKGAKYFESIYTTIVRQANELAYAIEKERYNKL